MATSRPPGRPLRPRKPTVLNETSIPEPPKGPKSKRGVRGWWRRRRRVTRIVILTAFWGFVLLVIGGLGFLYAITKVPIPTAVAEPQSITVDYANGTPIYTTGADRKDVPLSAVPIEVQDAVLAAEDRNYYSEPGISFTGILRAAYTDIRGGSITEGGSTITQQYAKNAYLTDQRTFTRKLKDIVLAIKLDHEYSKQQILDDYLNTIYFGRGAYGIDAAAEAYFDRPVQKLTYTQGALLAGLIREPSVLDPAVNLAASKQRYAEVIAAMLRGKWITPKQAANAPFPKTLALSQVATISQLTGPQYYINEKVDSELMAEGMTAQQIALGGFTVTTTLNPTDQAAAVSAVTSAPGGTVTAQEIANGIREGLVAVQPTTGAILAYYGGPSVGGTDLVSSSNAVVPPGSTMKAIVLAAALTAGIPLDTAYSGASPQVYPGNSTEIHNDDDESYGYLDLSEAMAYSVNTVYVHLGLTVGEAKVAAMAAKLGFPTVPLRDQVEDLPLGEDPSANPLEMAQVYATFASGGISSTPYLVKTAVARNGDVLVLHTLHQKRVLSTTVADEVTSALHDVLEFGTAAGTPLADGRPAAGKTGTTDSNKSAWFDGFTSQLVGIVDLWDYGHSPGDPKGPLAEQPLTDIGGYVEVYGADIPAHVWQDFMDLSLAGSPITALPGTTLPPVVPYPTYTPSASPSASASTGTSPSPSVTPTESAITPPPYTLSPSPTPVVSTPVTESPVPDPSRSPGLFSSLGGTPPAASPSP